jgi:hypothetical protein
MGEKKEKKEKHSKHSKKDKKDKKDKQGKHNKQHKEKKEKEPKSRYGPNEKVSWHERVQNYFDDCGNGTWGFEPASKAEAEAAAGPQTVRRDGAILTCAFSPDSRWLVVAGADRKACVILISDGSIVHETRMRRASIRSCGFSADSRFLALGGLDKKVLVLSTSDWSIVHQTAERKGEVYCCSFSQDGNWLVIGGQDRRTIVLSTSDWSEAEDACVPGRRVRCCDFSPDGNWLAVGGTDSKMSVKDVSSWAHADHEVENEGAGYHMLIRDGTVLTCAFSADSKWLVMGGVDQKAAVVSTHDWSVVYETRPRQDGGAVMSCAFSHDTKWLAISSGVNTKSVTVLKTEDWTTVYETPVRDGTGAIYACAFSGNGTWLAVAGADGKAIVYPTNAFLGEAGDVVVEEVKGGSARALMQQHLQLAAQPEKRLTQAWSLRPKISMMGAMGAGTLVQAGPSSEDRRLKAAAMKLGPPHKIHIRSYKPPREDENSTSFATVAGGAGGGYGNNGSRSRSNKDRRSRRRKEEDRGWRRKNNSLGSLLFVPSTKPPRVRTYAS